MSKFRLNLVKSFNKSVFKYNHLLFQEIINFKLNSKFRLLVAFMLLIRVRKSNSDLENFHFEIIDFNFKVNQLYQ